MLQWCEMGTSQDIKSWGWEQKYKSWPGSGFWRNVSFASSVETAQQGKTGNMHLTYVECTGMRCKKQKKVAIEKCLLPVQGQRPTNNRIVQVPSQLGMPHLTTDSGCPQQVFLLPSSDWTLLFYLLFTTFCNCNPAIIHKVLSLQFNWVKYVRISKNSVYVCAFCSSLPTWQNDWYHSNHSRVNADITEECSMKIWESCRISIMRGLKAKQWVRCTQICCVLLDLFFMIL